MNDGREKEREGSWEIGKEKPRKGERERGWRREGVREKGRKISKEFITSNVPR